MRHIGDSNELLEVASDELRPVIRDDARLCLRVLLFGSFQNYLDVGLPHRLTQIPVHDKTTVRDAHSWQSFQHPDKIADAIRLVSVVKLWEEVAKEIGSDASTVKIRVTAIIDRRDGYPLHSPSPYKLKFRGRFSIPAYQVLWRGESSGYPS